MLITAKLSLVLAPIDVSHHTNRVLEFTMSTVSTGAAVGPDGLSTSEPERSHLACFTARDLHAATVVVTAEGDIDACNARDLVDYAERKSILCTKLILDLSHVDFFCTQGFSALRELLAPRRYLDRSPQPRGDAPASGR